jgi:VanZ family protein
MHFESLSEMKEKLSRWILAWAPLVLYAGLIFYLSSRSVPRMLPSFRFSDKVLHMIEYGIFGYLAARALRASPGETPSQKIKFVLGLAIVALYGLSDEFHQSFIPMRDASIYDAFADIIGGGLGMFAERVIYLKLKKTKTDGKG